MNNRSRLVLAAALITMAGSAQAEFLGLLNGRSADPQALSDLSVEAGLFLGDDYQNVGFRVNYGLSDNIVLFGDFGLTEIDPVDGNSFGIGLFYFLDNQRILDLADLSAKFSYHSAALEGDAFDGLNAVPGDVDFRNLAFEVLLSGRDPIASNGLMWYTNLGVNILDADGRGGDTDTDLLIGAGAYLPVGAGQVYAGADLIDELIIGAGYRYLVQ